MYLRLGSTDANPWPVLAAGLTCFILGGLFGLILTFGLIRYAGWGAPPASTTAGDGDADPLLHSGPSPPRPVVRHALGAITVEVGETPQ